MNEARVELSRDLTLFDITMIGVGAMIGAGIFVLTGIAAGAAGPALIISFALNGIITLFTAMAYAELGSAIPGAGGGYLWVKEGLPGPTAFLAGWMDWFAHAVAGSLYALGFGAHVGLVFQEFGVHIPGVGEAGLQKIFSAIVIVTFVYINYRGASETGKAGNIITVLKVLIIGMFIASGLWAIFGNPSYLQKFQDFSPNGLVGIFSAMGLTFIAFEGYEIIVQAGEEVKNPRRNIPRAVFLSLAIVIPIYMLVAFVSMGAVNPEGGMATYQWLAEHAELGVVEAARQFMPLGTILLIIGGVLSTMSALNATTYSSTRVSFAMGRDRNLPDAFADIHPKTRTPYKALLLSGVVILVMALAIPIEAVATAADIMFLLLFIQVNVAAITLRKKYGDRLQYGFLIPFFPYIPIVVIIFKLGLAIFMFSYSPVAWAYVIVWIVAGVAIYYLYSRPREDAGSRSTVISGSKLLPNPVDPEQYRVLVPIANPESLPGLLAPAVNAARQHDGGITLLHIIKVPDQLPLSAGREYIERSEPLRQRALELMEHEDIPIEIEIRISHRLSRAIVETAEEKAANLLILGWRGERRIPDTRIGRNIDDLIERVNCKVLVVQQALHSQPGRILIPVQDPQQVRFALEAVGYLTGAPIVEKVVFHVLPPGSTDETQESVYRQIGREIDAFEKRFPKTAGSTSIRTVLSADPIERIIEEANAYDYVILGATRDGWLKRRFFDSAPLLLTERIEAPVALTRPRTHAFGFGVRQILNFVWGGYLDIDPRSQRELMEQGLLLPAERARPKSLPTVNRVGVVLMGALGVVSVITMFAGAGQPVTWLGAAGFIVALWLFTWLVIRPRRLGAAEAAMD